MDNPGFVYEIYIRASAEAVWNALTQAEFTSQFFHATHVESDWQTDSDIYYRAEPGGRIAVSGKIIQCIPLQKLEITWLVEYDASGKAEGPSRVCFELEAQSDNKQSDHTQADQTRLRVVHDGFPEVSTVQPRIREGWPWILSSLKSLLETDSALAANG